MLKKTVIGRFVRDWIAPSFPDFHLYEGMDLVRVCRPLLHGIVFEQASDESIYVTCFVQHLFERKDYLAIGFGERMRRLDRPGRSFKPEPADYEAKQLLASMRRSPFSPINLDPTCAKIIEMAKGLTVAVHDLFGLGCCAILENEPDLARQFLKQTREQLRPPDDQWQKKMNAEIDQLLGYMDKLPDAQNMIRNWVEETIRLLKLDDFA